VLAAGIAAVARAGEKHTKTGRKERPTEAPLRLLFLLFFTGATISEKPVAAQMMCF
jgi:hypothetical protein